MKFVLVLALLVVAVCVLDLAEGRPSQRRPSRRPTVDRPRPNRPNRRQGGRSRLGKEINTAQRVPPTGLPSIGRIAKKVAKKVAKKLARVNSCSSESECKPRQCCIRRVSVAEDSTVTFGRKGKCVPLMHVTNTSKFTLNVLKVQDVADPISTLVDSATGPPTQELLFICPSQSLEDSDARRRRAKKAKKAKKIKTVNAEALLPDLLAPDVAIGSRVPEATPEPAATEPDTGIGFVSAQ